MFSLAAERCADGREHRCVAEARLPDVPAGLGEEPRGHVLRVRLARLLRELDCLLYEPLEIEHGARGPSAGHTVWVFGAFGYRVDRIAREVVFVRRVGKRVLRQDFALELLHPLTNHSWLPFVLRSLGLSDFGPQGHLFRRARSIEREEDWIARAAYRRLLRDARFRDLRRRRLPAALALDPELCRIALASRNSHLRDFINSAHYSRIWRHERAFRAAARENPRLLPLVFAALHAGEIEPHGDLAHCDLILQTHRCLRSLGLPRAAWRHLARHGVDFLFAAWRRLGGKPLEATALLLGELSRAGIALPPQEAALALWLAHWPYGVRLPSRDGGGAPQPIPPAVLGAFLREAQRVAGSAQAAAWEEDLRVVFEWACVEQPRLDKPQRRAGWPWLMREARAWERRRILLEHDGPRAWTSALGSFESGAYRATAILSLEAMLDEGAAFHNCLGGLAGACASGRNRFFAVREARSGVRVAVALLEWLDERQAWALGNLKGPANSDVPLPVLEFGRLLAAEYQRRAAHLPPPRPSVIPARSAVIPAASGGDPGLEAHALSHRICILGP